LKNIGRSKDTFGVLAASAAMWFIMAAAAPCTSFSADQSGEREYLPRSAATAEYLEVENGRLFYEVFGNGFPLVLIHDGIAHREVWDDLVADIGGDYRVIRYDRRGYGRSDVPTTPYSNLADLHALAEHLKLGRAVFVGSSSGGGLAIDYALAYPDRVEALVLVGPVVGGLGYSFHFMRRAYEAYSTDEEKNLYNWINDPYAITRRTLSRPVERDPRADIDRHGRARYSRCPRPRGCDRSRYSRIPADRPR